MSNIRKTSFGSLEHLLELGGQVVTELATFTGEGKSHTHELYEVCYVLSGTGIIVSGERRYSVKPGDVVSIPPRTGHWMIPEENSADPLKILLVYSQNNQFD